MPLHRREVLRLLGTGAAEAMILALGGAGCGGSPPIVRRAPQVSVEVRSWLQDAVARLAATYPSAHALAVSRRRTTAARDVLGAGIARQHTDGAVLTVRDRSGAWREYVTSELTRNSIAAAADALDAAQRPRSLDFGRAPAIPAEPPPLDELDLQRRVERLLVDDPVRAPRIVYAAAAIDLDDAIVWSVAPGRDLTQRLVRIRTTAVRAAWNGTRPVVRDATRAFTGWLDDQPLTADDLAAASDAALEVITPGGFDDGVRTVVLDPSIVALVIDTLARDLLTVRPADRAIADDAPLASKLVTLVDDPTSPGAYGGFAFDDEGQPAAPLPLIDAGRITARLGDRATGSATGGTGRGRRPGHLGPIAPAPSHLRLVPGTADLRQLRGDGFSLEAGITATLDPGRARLRIACARARELKAGNPTGRLYADVELVAPLRDLLGHIDAVAATAVTFAPSGGPLWRSIAAPAVRTRGLVRAARST